MCSRTSKQSATSYRRRGSGSRFSVRHDAAALEAPFCESAQRVGDVRQGDLVAGVGEHERVGSDARSVVEHSSAGGPRRDVHALQRAVVNGIFGVPPGQVEDLSRRLIVEPNQRALARPIADPGSPFVGESIGGVQEPFGYLRSRKVEVFGQLEHEFLADVARAGRENPAPSFGAFCEFKGAVHVFFN